MKSMNLAAVCLLFVAGLAVLPANATPGVGNAIAVAAGGTQTCVLLSGGNVDCYGENTYGQSSDYLGGDATAVSAGWQHTCVLKSTRNVDCYGDNTYGQAADYTAGDALSVAAGGFHSCVVRVNGNVACWGLNGNGQANAYTGGDATAVATGKYHTCVLKSNGNVDCYGSNSNGQAADYLGLNAVAVVAGGWHTCVLKSAGSPRVDCYGLNTNGQAADPTGTTYTSISAGARHTCLLSGGQVDCYGDNSYGQVSNPSTTDTLAVSAGATHTCLLKSGGTVDCFGDSTAGKNADFTAPSPPQNVVASPGNQGEITLSWDGPVDSGSSAVTNYGIYRSSASGLETPAATVGDVRTWTDTGLADDTTYYYTVTAISSVGESAYSNEASATTPPAPTPIPGVPGVPSANSSMVYMPTTPGQPMPIEASDFALSFNEVFLTVDPAGHLTLAPGAVFPTTMSVVVFFMHPADAQSVISQGATLRVTGPTGAVASYHASPNIEAGASTTDFFVEFRGVSPVQGVRYVLSYAGRDLAFTPVFAKDVSTDPCSYEDGIPTQCGNPPPNPCTYAPSAPVVCGPAPQPCDQVLLQQVPPCGPPPSVCPEGAVQCVCSLVPCQVEVCPGGGYTCITQQVPCGAFGKPSCQDYLCGGDSCNVEVCPDGGLDCVPSLCGKQSVTDCVCGDAGCNIGICQDGGIKNCLPPTLYGSESEPQSNQECARMIYGKDTQHSEGYMTVNETRNVGVNYTAGHHYDRFRFVDDCTNDAGQYREGLGYVWHGPAVQAGGTDFDVGWHVLNVATTDSVGLRPFVYYGPVSGAAVHVNEAHAVGRRSYCNDQKSWPIDILNAVAMLADASIWFKELGGALDLVPAFVDAYCDFKGTHWDPVNRQVNGQTDGGKGVAFEIKDGTTEVEYGGEVDLTAGNGAASGNYRMDLTSASVAYVSWYSSSGDSINARVLVGEQHMAPKACIANTRGDCPV